MAFFQLPLALASGRAGPLSGFSQTLYKFNSFGLQPNVGLKPRIFMIHPLAKASGNLKSLRSRLVRSRLDLLVPAPRTVAVLFSFGRRVLRGHWQALGEELFVG